MNAVLAGLPGPYTIWTVTWQSYRAPTGHWSWNSKAVTNPPWTRLSIALLNALGAR